MKNRDILHQLLRVLAGEAVCIALMLGVYALLQKLTASVLLGALAGGVIAIGNFFFLIMAVSRAMDKAAETGDAAKAKAQLQGGTAGRMLVLFLLYFVILKTGKLDSIAALLPLIFVQLSLRVTEFFRKEDKA